MPLSATLPESAVIRAVVTDIEGTTSSIAFVHEVLFPYARSHLGDFLRKHYREAAVADCLQNIRQTTGKDMALEDIICQLDEWMATDRKITELKTLQGFVWADGYANGDFKGHIYEDAWRQLAAWHRQGISLYIYSSGSVRAQQLLFGHTAYGDLNELFAGYFDTRIGAKTEQASYRHIAEQLAVPAAEILFLSDIRQELDAARAAGMQTRWLVRDGAVDKAAEHIQVTDFNKISPGLL